MNKKIEPKKIIYIIMTMIFGGLTGCLLYGLFSLGFILQDYLYPLFIVLGALGGIPLGFRWWKIIYIEHRHWRSRGKKR